jgi:nitrate reductase gamma subunit
MSMNWWLDFAKGPLFSVAFLTMVLGLGRHVLLQTHALVTRKRRRLRLVPWKRVATETLSWALPIRHLIRGTIVISAASFLFHVGAIIVPVFLADHVRLWEAFWGVELPSIDRGLADGLTLLTLCCAVVLLSYRIVIRRSRELSRPSDYILLVLIVMPFLSGYLAAHPSVNPLPWQTMLLIHVLSADVLMFAVPFTKLAHMVLFPFDRLSAVHWQLRPGAGDRVAEALYGKEARV